jgi:uncharacterized protein involved in outer membrane biogenesis
MTWTHGGMARRLLLILLSFLALILVVIGGALASVVWNPEAVKPVLEQLASGRLGRQVRIQGPIAIDLGRVVTVGLTDVRVAAPDWAEASHLAEVASLEVGFDVLTYLDSGRIHLAELRLDRPQLVLERNAQGRTSWPTPTAQQPAGEQPQGGGGLPRIDALSLDNGQVRYQDAVIGLRLDADVATTEPADGGYARLIVDGQGQLEGRPVDLKLEIGTLAVLSGQEPAPLPVEGHVTVAGSRLALGGELRGLSLAAELTSDDPGPLLALAGRPVDAALPPLQATARLTRPEAAFELDRFQASWGDIRLEGRASYDPTGAPPVIRADLDAPVLDLVPLWPC